MKTRIESWDLTENTECDVAVVGGGSLNFIFTIIAALFSGLKIWERGNRKR